MKDSELKKNATYWAEVTDQELSGSLGQQVIVKFTGIFFNDLKTPGAKYLLSQIKIFREASPSEITSCNSNPI